MSYEIQAALVTSYEIQVTSDVFAAGRDLQSRPFAATSTHLAGMGAPTYDGGSYELRDTSYK